MIVSNLRLLNHSHHYLLNQVMLFTPSFPRGFLYFLFCYSRWSIHIGVFTAFGTITFAFVCHGYAFQVFQSLTDATPSRWSRTVSAAMTMSVVICFMMGLFGWSGFYGDLHSDIILSLPSSSIASTIARLAMAFQLCFKYPLRLFICRHIFIKAMNAPSAAPGSNDNVVAIKVEPSNKQHVLVTIAIWVLTTVSQSLILAII
jgi:amino acid permease